MGNDISKKMFEQRLEKIKGELIVYIDKMIEPILEKGRAALAEYQENERRLKDETFSRN